MGEEGKLESLQGIDVRMIEVDCEKCGETREITAAKYKEKKAHAGRFVCRKCLLKGISK